MKTGIPRVGTAPQNVETPTNRYVAFIPVFSQPQCHWPRVPPPPALGQSGGEGAAGVSPRGTPLQFRRTRGGLGSISGSEILPYLNNSDTPGTKHEFSRRTRGRLGYGARLRYPSIYLPPRHPGKSSSPGSTPPRTVKKPQSHGPITDWLRRV